MSRQSRLRGIFELYRDDPELGDAVLWGRRSDPITRRGFLNQAGLTAMGAAIGMTMPFSGNFPAGLIPAAFAEADSPFVIPGKNAGLVVLNDRPINAETPAHLLVDEITPTDRLFVRNNGLPPNTADASTWTLEVAGESALSQRTFSIAELKGQFEHHTLRLQLECGGNGRSEYRPRAPGNQWSTGAIGCPEWTGVRLRDVLEKCGIAPDAVYVAYYGADRHLSGDPAKIVISRGVPITKAIEDESLIAFAMNGEDIPALHGAPLRLVCGGWPGSVSGKWLRRIEIRDRVHDGAKMTGRAYRVPCRPVPAGSEVADEEMCIIESMSVKSLITSIRSGEIRPAKVNTSVSGFAWAGDDAVSSVDLSIDFGQTWTATRLAKPANRLAWQAYAGQIRFPQKGYYEVWARATDTRGRAQPMLVPGWNPKGYLNNACHRVAVRAV